MRKVSPADIKTDFTTSLDELSSFYVVTSGLLTLGSQRTFLTENSLLAAAVLWEGFVSDLLVAYINRDSSRFTIHLVDALKDGLSRKQATILDTYGRLIIPGHLKKSEIQDIVDGNGNNVTFSNFGDLVDQARRWLVSTDAARFSDRTKRQKAVVNALISIRNQLAHRSERSHKAMNVALGQGALHVTGLQRGQKKINHVGAYLKSMVASQGKTRLEVYLNELRTVAAAL